MPPIWTIALAALACAAPTLAAADEAALDGPMIEAALENRTAFYDSGERQFFQKGGATIYVDLRGVEDRGRWEVREDQYCSWCERGGWSCYDMTGSSDRVVFKAPSEGGRDWPATMHDGDQR